MHSSPGWEIHVHWVNIYEYEDEGDEDNAKEDWKNGCRGCRILTAKRITQIMMDFSSSSQQAEQHLWKKNSSASKLRGWTTTVYLG